ncbi:glycosyltransferase WbsX family protein [Anaerosacchariphilus polymeriproducens]|uniref:Glycosyl transferase n=1 Tax=Anaerosacchariphilus polymeriproducens TaxID=1812858 RepID=A0A371AR11_9FIRM|nr:glycoside hydrolase family 99-like domain-containing protein [Anaerosacchariphilus polymeriproducens]RDU21999.1 glycosyl transferase [Anaerosacchariphilus polymeriproducens]
MKLIAMYLPQYHRIKENDLWWGNGYTEWEAVKRAVPLFKGHEQPKVPYNKNYYDLSNEDAKTLKWQVDLANEYGIFGFCFYHYWFKDNKQLLEKPMEILLAHPEININYCICWANESWTRTWYGLEQEVLMEQDYGGLKEWENHFNYLLPFFKDTRYIKINEKPVVHIYKSCEIEELSKMKDCWNKLAHENGFPGIYLITANTGGGLERREELVDAYYNFEPGFTLNHRMKFLERLLFGLRIWMKMQLNKLLHKKKIERIIDAKKIYKYMKRELLVYNKPVFKGTYVSWDNTPRRSFKGLYYKNTSPKLFYKSLLDLKRSVGEDEFVYINAWNEWGEGCFLEPDEENGFQYLEMIKRAVEGE